MLSTICISLSLLCGVSGIALLVAPRRFMQVGKVMNKGCSTEKIREHLDREINTDKLRELLDKSFEFDEKIFNYYRLIGLVTLVVGILLLVTFVLRPLPV